jgi:hypothetical protein
MIKRTFVVACAVAAFALVFGWNAVRAFNPQPDPPGFGMVGILPDETIRLNVVCYEHQVGATPPDPCRGELMFHNAVGTVLARRLVSLGPGESASLDFAITPDVNADETEIAAPRLGISPCIIPAPDSGRMIPSAEVISNTTGHTSLFLNVATPRMAFFDGPIGAVRTRIVTDVR